jgi:uncharacterized membrane protein YeiB
VILAQYSQSWAWPLMLGPKLQGYVRLIGDNANFAVLPWGGFVFAGAWLGRVFAEPRDAVQDRALHIKIAIAGMAIFVAAYAGSFGPALTPSKFWTNSTSWFLIRIGVMLMLVYLAWLWMQRKTADRWSPIVVFGQTSLFVYWVHVEVVYGFPTYPLRHELSMGGVLVAYAVFTLVMLGAAMLWQRRRQGPLIPAELRAS